MAVRNTTRALTFTNSFQNARGRQSAACWAKKAFRVNIYRDGAQARTLVSSLTRRNVKLLLWLSEYVLMPPRLSSNSVDDMRQ